MSYTFFESGESKVSKDTISLTRYCGPASLSGSRHCVQINFRKHGAPYDVWTQHGYVSITRDEAIALRDNLSRFINGVKDGESVGTFVRPMSAKEHQRLNQKAFKIRLWK